MFSITPSLHAHTSCHTPFKGSWVNYARAEAAVRCRASAPGSGCSPGCQSPPIKFPAPALMSSAAMCAEYNGAELFACAAARRFTGCRAGAQPGRLGTMTARSSARLPRGGIIEPKLSEPWVGCDDATRLPGPSAWGEPSRRCPRGCQPPDVLVSRGSGGIAAIGAGRSRAGGFTLANCSPAYLCWLPGSFTCTGRSQRMIKKKKKQKGERT